jgi:thiamine biosynthesis lipoprotein
MGPGEPRKDISTPFQAMASPCMVLVDTADAAIGARAGAVVKTETLRIEAKYSRYRPSVVTTINQSAGREVELDAETADLIDYAVTCYQLSGGRFDITSGALRRVWRFDGTGAPPDSSSVLRILPFVGWHRVSWNRPLIRLPAGMEIDLGGIGKEYAVDRALRLARAETDAPLLVNLGGDLRVSGPRRDGSPWRVAIEDVDQAGATSGLLDISHGALATSGDTYRHVKDRGTRYGHVLDPRSGWPVPDAPRSVTVHAASCSEAGLLAKLALLRGAEAEAFLRAEQVRAWCVR